MFTIFVNVVVLLSQERCDQGAGVSLATGAGSGGAESTVNLHTKLTTSAGK